MTQPLAFTISSSHLLLRVICFCLFVLLIPFLCDFLSRVPLLAAAAGDVLTLLLFSAIRRFTVFSIHTADPFHYLLEFRHVALLTCGDVLPLLLFSVIGRFSHGFITCSSSACNDH